MWKDALRGSTVAHRGPLAHGTGHGLLRSVLGLLLVADVGGTKTDLAVLDPAGGPRAAVAAGRLPSSDYPSLEALLAAFLEKQRCRA